LLLLSVSYFRRGKKAASRIAVNNAEGTQGRRGGEGVTDCIMVRNKICYGVVLLGEGLALLRMWLG